MVAVHRAEWQTITWILVSVALAVIGVLGAFAKAGAEQYQRWQLSRSTREHSAGG